MQLCFLDFLLPYENHILEFLDYLTFLFTAAAPEIGAEMKMGTTFSALNIAKECGKNTGPKFSYTISWYKNNIVES